ncbi:MAG: divergent PAP2 family protein [Streptococcaceae bacterium]|jgi:acid phosphatase family membrane protein YuiD|nr:divergent PAP2 family protein [Streptococcaceae bacterium]
MTFFTELANNKIFWTAVVSWAIAQLLKIVIELAKNRRFDWRLLFATGGMPSSHSSFVVALAVATGMKLGFDSDFFAIAAVLAFIVMYDAQGVRRQAGTQAHIINVMLENLENTGIKLDKNLKEFLGHTPIQVIGGAILGIIVALVMR